MLARRLTTILPEMSLAEAIDTTRIHRVAGLGSARTAWVTARLSALHVIQSRKGVATVYDLVLQYAYHTSKCPHCGGGECLVCSGLREQGGSPLFLSPALVSLLLFI
jgi:Magnesium chelatase, subunit ChlI